MTCLKKISLIGCDKLTNAIFELISEKCEGLEELEVGGEPMIYNTVFNKKGKFYLTYSTQ
jgi:hypothetical protein